MSNHYSLDGDRVLYLGSPLLSFDNVVIALLYAMCRKTRRLGYHKRALDELKRTGQARWSWKNSRSPWGSDRYTIEFSMWLADDGFYRIRCYTDEKMREYAVGRINRAVVRNGERFVEKEARKHRTEERRLRQNERRKLEKLRRKQAQRIEAPKQERKPKKLAKSTKHVLELVPQFRKHELFWKEAIEAVVAIFGVKGDGVTSAKELAKRELQRSLSRHDENASPKWATFSRQGFSLMFVVPDGRFRGDITPCLIRSTKDNKHPLYRRMRRYFRHELGFLSTEERQSRKRVASMTNVVSFGGALYRVA